MFWDRFFLDFRLILALCAENLPRFVEISPSHGMPTFDCYTSMPFYRWAEIFQGGWGGGGPPQGVSISATHRRCAVRAGSPAQSSSAKCQDQSQMANLKSQAHSARLRSYTLFFSLPRKVGMTGIQSLNLLVLLFRAS